MAEMSEKAKAMRRAYIKAWKKSHPDRVKEHTRKYWEKKAAEAERLAQVADEDAVVAEGGQNDNS